MRSVSWHTYIYYMYVCFVCIHVYMYTYVCIYVSVCMYICKCMYVIYIYIYIVTSRTQMRIRFQYISANPLLVSNTYSQMRYLFSVHVRKCVTYDRIAHASDKFVTQDA